MLCIGFELDITFLIKPLHTSVLKELAGFTKFGIFTFDKSIPCGMLAFCFFLKLGNLHATAIQQLQQSCFISSQLIKEYYQGEKI